jgi:hypothetical protein
MAGAGEKRARQLFSTHNVATVERWGDDLLEWVWGMREDTSVATKERAHACINVCGKIYCNCCGKDYMTHKGDFNTHLDSKQG